jgi:signal transduction histidine kinase
MEAKRWRQLGADRRVIDAALVVGCLALTALAVKTPWSSLPLPVIVAAGTSGSLFQWYRRRWPVAAVLVGGAACALSGNPGPLLVGGYSGAAYATGRRLWLSGALAWAGYLAWAWLDNGRLTWDDAAYGGFATGVVFVIGRYLAARTALLGSLRERAEQVEAERGLREERARIAERNRIAREMHDVVAHKVSLIALYAGALELHAGDNTRLREGTEVIRVTAREALQDLHNVLTVLRTGSGDPGEPFDDLASLVRASADAGHPVELHDRAGPLPPATARVVYRVVQEGLTNVHKHAPQAPTTVSVHRDDRSVTVTVTNEASTAASLHLPGSGSGLAGLAERVRLVGGSLRGGPAGRGWELHAVIPWPDRRPEVEAS